MGIGEDIQASQQIQWRTKLQMICVSFPSLRQHYACGALPAELLTRKALSKDLKRLACLKAVRNAED
uniref:Uncharacterized protein n=1 Tax=Toxoplasma gondii COUG TaxID=1074873 RepID=A0A2G8XPJ0_TOXGO|nr:hypothetical protein TGCOUG_309185 [Toxoplasma gondii COUG]